jgi:hypothetical protein
MVCACQYAMHCIRLLQLNPCLRRSNQPEEAPGGSVLGIVRVLSGAISFLLSDHGHTRLGLQQQAAGITFSGLLY